MPEPEPGQTEHEPAPATADTTGPAPGRFPLSPKVERVLELAREHLHMEISFLSEFVAGRQIYRQSAGDPASFGISPGPDIDLRNTYCYLMIEGHIPNAVPDSHTEPALREMAATTVCRIGSYIGVPLWLSDGSLYRTFCCLSHTAQPLDTRDVSYLSMLADILVDELEAEHRLALDSAGIDTILANGSIDTVFQPIIRLTDGRPLGAEALSRFPGAGTPDTVFERAHQTGRGTELETLAARQAISHLPALPDDRYLAVNLSPAVVEHAANQVLGACGGDLGRLVLEVTETGVVHRYSALRELIAPLRAQGLRLAVDDAGAGYASLRHIIELRPDIIKLDRSLINGVAQDTSRRSAVRAFTGLAEDLNALTVAEGIETIADLNAARDLGVTAGQGYLLGPPRRSLTGAPTRRKH